MTLESQHELDATRDKLRLLQQSYADLEQDSVPDEHLRELTLRSLKHLINSLAEEIARFESRLSATKKTA